MSVEHQFVLSTIGISLFLRMAGDIKARSRLNHLSNKRELSSEDKAWVDELGKQAFEELMQGDIERRRRASAELNGLYALYDNDLSAAGKDMHWLISTDTYVGRKAAEVVEQFLKEQKTKQCSLYIPQELSTASLEAFSQGMQNLLRWCENTVPGYMEHGYRVIFNLTGGFKSLQGHLNIVGMFYADEIVYIFEGSDTLLRIPRLPIRLNSGVIRTYAAQIAMMAAGHMFPYEQISALPEGLIETDSQGNATISDWGLLIWNRLKHDLLQESPLPFLRLVYLPSFRRDFEKAQPQDRIRLQETLALVASNLEENQGNTVILKQHPGVQYDNYVNKKDKDGHPIGHFRVSQDLRVSCSSKNGNLYLRRFGQEPDVNKNP